MTVKITFFDREGALSLARRKAFKDNAMATLDAMSAHLVLPDIDVLILTTGNYSQGLYSFTGHTIGPHTTMFFVDPTIETLEGDVEAYFSALLAHELHHCLRWPFFRKTIGEAIVLEGMAMSAEMTLGFDRRDLGARPSEAVMEAMFAKALDEIDATHDGSWIYHTPQVDGDSWNWIYHLGQHVVDVAFEAEGWDAFSQIDKSAHDLFEAVQRAKGHSV